MSPYLQSFIDAGGFKMDLTPAIEMTPIISNTPREINTIIVDALQIERIEPRLFQTVTPDKLAMINQAANSMQRACMPLVPTAITGIPIPETKED